jgi:hypothetical protein
MPDLTKSTVIAWLEQREPSVAILAGGAVRPLEDDAEVRTALGKLGHALDASLNRDASVLSGQLCEPSIQTGLRDVLVQLGPARLLRVLHWLTFSGLPAGEKVVAGLLEDEPSGTGAKLRAAVQHLHRQALLARIFSKDRLRILLNACQGQQPEAA